MRKVTNRNRLRTWEVFGGACCFVAGILAPVLGILLTASEWIVGADGPWWLHAAATALFIVAIPLILFAGFCLDWAESRQQRPLLDREDTTEDMQEELATWRQRLSGS